MSSLAATQADGYYIPPAYLESGAYRKKSLNQFNDSRGHNQFLTRSVCRFELPFDGFCVECDAIVGKGTRFNAHKSHVDDYFTTKIYEFVTTCRGCGKCEFRIRTNPKERTFDYVSGIRRKVEEFDTADAGTHGVIDTEFGNGILRYENGMVEGPGVDDASAHGRSSMLHLLEKGVVGHRKAQTEHDRMTSLLGINSRMVDDARANASIRKAFRTDRRAKKRRFEEAAKLGLGRGIELLDHGKKGEGGDGMEEEEEDATSARRAMDARCREEDDDDLRAHRYERDRFRNVRAGGIFASKIKGGVTTNDPRRNDEKRHGAHIILGGRGKSWPKRKTNTGDDGRKSRPSTGESGDGGGKSFHAEGGALAALSSCYASDSD